MIRYPPYSVIEFTTLAGWRGGPAPRRRARCNASAFLESYRDDSPLHDGGGGEAAPSWVRLALGGWVVVLMQDRWYTGEAAGGGGGSLRLLAGNRPFRLLWTARVVSFLGDSLSLTALMLYVAETTEQALVVALLLLAGDFTPALLGPLTGAVSDRFDLKRVMVACELAQGGLVAVTAFWLPSLPMLLVLVGLRAVAGRVFAPASRAAVPVLVHDRDLRSTNATAVGIGTNGGEALGPLVAALLLPGLGVRGVLLLDACTFALSAALLALRPLPPRHVSQLGQPASFLAETRAGPLPGQPERGCDDYHPVRTRTSGAPAPGRRGGLSLRPCPGGRGSSSRRRRCLARPSAAGSAGCLDRTMCT